MRGERRRERRTSVTGRGQKAEDECEFRGEKAEQKRNRKTECFCHCIPTLVKQVRGFCKEESPPWTDVRFCNKEVGRCW